MNEKNITDILKKNKYKNSKSDIFKSIEFKEYIKNCKTLNLYIDQLSDHLIKYLNENNNINYECIGKIFMALYLYIDNPDIEISKNNDIKLSQKEIILCYDIINIYNNTMYYFYTKSNNIKKRYKKTLKNTT